MVPAENAFDNRKQACICQAHFMDKRMKSKKFNSMVPIQLMFIWLQED